MEEENKHLLNDDKVKPKAEDVKEEAPKSTGGGGGGWGGWGFSPLSVLSDLQKAAEEISRNVRISLLSLLCLISFRFWPIRVYRRTG